MSCLERFKDVNLWFSDVFRGYRNVTLDKKWVKVPQDFFHITPGIFAVIINRLCMYFLR